MTSFNSAVMLAKVETTFGVDPTPTPAANALFITEPPGYTANAQRVQRNPARASLSKFPGRTGRITSGFTFMHEVIGSGVSDASVAPPVDALLRSCAYARTDITEAGIVQYWAKPGNTGVATFANGGTNAYTPDYVRYFTLTCTTGGGSGSAVVTVSSPEMDLPNGTTLAAISTTGVGITNGTEFALGNGAKIAGTITTALAIGDRFVIQVGPPGSLYTPVSTAMESLTAYLYFDGVLHKTRGARGNFDLECVAGDVGKFKFTFQGDWVDPVDASIPTDAVLTELEPAVVEFANVRLDNVEALCPVNFAVSSGNTLALKQCANSAQGYAGGQINGRTATVKFDSDFVTEATYPFWGRFKTAQEVDFSFNVGTERGNMLHVLSHCQFAQNAYGNRDGQRIYDINAEAVSRFGDDELSLYFH